MTLTGLANPMGMLGRLGLVMLCAALVLAGCKPKKPSTPQTPTATQETTKPVTPNPLISRQDLFSNPVQYQGRISPDGAKVSWLALSDGALNLFVADADGSTPPKQYTFGKDGVELHRWTPNSAYILYAGTFADTKTTRVFALNVQTGAVRDLVPVNEGDYVWLVGVSKNWPNTALVRLRRAGQPNFDLYRINLESGEKTLVAKNPGFAYWVTDSDYVPRLGIRKNKNGSQTWIVLGPGGTALPLLSVKADDVPRTRPEQMDATSTSLYLIDGRDREFSAFTRIDLQTGEQEILATGKDGDIETTLFHPITAQPLAYFTNGPRPHWQSLSTGFQPILDQLEKTLGPRFFILAATNTAEQLVIYSDRPDQPGVYSLYDLEADKITTLFETMPALENRKLAKSEILKIQARDGMELTAYFTPARGEQPTRAPLVVLPQPWLNSRVEYGFDPRIQWLSNRGYNVLEVNTRGAVGLGKSYTEAGTGKGILLAKTDLEDAVNAVLDNELADKTRVAGFGWGNGGRMILNLAALKGSPLQCALVIDPIIDVQNAIMNGQQKGQAKRYIRWLAGTQGRPDPRLAKAISPLSHTNSIKASVLLLQSHTNAMLDPDLARQFVKDIRQNGGNAAMVYFPEITEKLFGQPEFIPYAALSEAFLAKCLDGQAEPVGNTLDTLTMEVNAGPAGVPGLKLRQAE
ncbi:MAG: prolyl oligopeptidase family serine peptidase [Robiginitomaculum sp.]|nr:prolyl oligopeptidase family serine peptidase [Robiginitomaculum sp.]MDQ7077142.1 prolyl oligopeptidase family serine peptidase [Robiginitomaculum sp.]